MIKWLRRLVFRRVSVVDRLPELKGKVIENEPLAKKTWFGVGGAAEVYIEPANVDDLSLLLKQFPDEPLTILGAGSNLLIRDGGIPGVTVKLGKPFAGIRVEGNRLICGAAAMLMEVARVAEKHKISGFEFISGIPGSVGGGIRMNAGAYRQALADRLVSLTVVMANGEVTELDPHEMDVFGYRQCYLPTDWIFVEAVFAGTIMSDADEIKKRMAEYKKHRESSQPQGVRTAGSTFKNPDGLMAWQLIEKAGLRGAKVGGAVVSEKHANFLINTGNATAADIEALGEMIRHKVKKKCGVRLEWEIKKLGVEK